MARNQILQWGLVAFALISAAICLAKILRDPGSHQWDMKVYYQAPRLLDGGVDPYAARAGDYTGFVYPPLQLQTFGLLVRHLSDGQFFYLYLALKVVCLIGLIYLWRTTFCAGISVGLFAVFAWAGLGAPFKHDLYSGNIAVFETTLMFAAFRMLLGGFPVLAALMIVAAASFKLTLIVFLLVLLFPLTTRGAFAFGTGVAAFLGYSAANFWLYPDLSQSFLHQAFVRVSDETGAISPSTLTVIRDGVEQFLGAQTQIAVWLYVALTLVILALSVGTLARAKERKNLILFSVLVYAITVPRMKDYSFMLVLPSVLCVFYSLRRGRWPLLITAMLLPNIARTPRGLPFVLNEIWVYYALMMSFVAWWLCTHGEMIAIARPGKIVGRGNLPQGMHVDRD